MTSDGLGRVESGDPILNGFFFYAFTTGLFRTFITVTWIALDLKP